MLILSVNSYARISYRIAARRRREAPTPRIEHTPFTRRGPHVARLVRNAPLVVPDDELLYVAVENGVDVAVSTPLRRSLTSW